MPFTQGIALGQNQDGRLELVIYRPHWLGGSPWFWFGVARPGGPGGPRMAAAMAVIGRCLGERVWRSGSGHRAE